MRERTVTNYFLKTLNRSQRRVHHQFRETVNKGLGFHPNKRKTHVLAR